MTSKPPGISPGSSGSVALALPPPSIDLSNKLLASAIPLPPNASVACAVFSPTTSPAHHPDTIEIARRHVLNTGKPSLLDSLLCTVHVENGAQQLYVFSVGPSDGTSDPLDRLTGLQLDDLICESSKHTIHFTRIVHFDPFLLDRSLAWEDCTDIATLHSVANIPFLSHRDPRFQVCIVSKEYLFDPAEFNIQSAIN
jgi:hypothetical protein